MDVKRDLQLEWWTFIISEENYIDKEQLIHANAISNGLIFNIAMTSNNQTSVDELTKIVEAIQLND